MKTMRIKFLLLLPAIIISCNTVKNNNPQSLYAGLDRNAPANMLTKKEKIMAGNYCLMDKAQWAGMGTI